MREKKQHISLIIPMIISILALYFIVALPPYFGELRYLLLLIPGLIAINFFSKMF